MMKKIIRKKWLHTSFWRIKLPMEVRATRLALLFIFILITTVSMMAVYDRTERVPEAGLFVGVCLSSLSIYIFLLFTKHNQKICK